MGGSHDRASRALPDASSSQSPALRPRAFRGYEGLPRTRRQNQDVQAPPQHGQVRETPLKSLKYFSKKKPQGIEKLKQIFKKTQAKKPKTSKSGNYDPA